MLSREKQETIIGETYFIYDPIETIRVFVKGPLLYKSVINNTNFNIFHSDLEKGFVLVKGYGSETIQLIKNICLI